MNLNGLRIQQTDGERVIQGDMDENYNSSENFYSTIYNPLMFTTRILEDYFINYTSNYVIATTYQLDELTEDWKNIFLVEQFTIHSLILISYQMYL
ncbi:hypothetical protein [Spiroplasma endosymbiont of Cantharis nigra]|uniref:hypothetical protein n=1 Tax=Spiroplasma endosymbiont of Cantharis nigra TaxID=3066278 RepID=UPI0030CDCE9A